MTEPLSLSAGPIEAVFLPDAGARLHRLRAFGVDLLRTPDDPARHEDEPFDWGAYVMAPWANRIGAEPATVAGRPITPRANFPDGTAIHGQVYLRPWERDGDRLRIEGGGDGEWPWRYEVALRPTARETGLRLEYALVNRADAAMPAGIGLHPWWRAPLEIAIRAASVYRTTSESPAHAEPVAGPFDRRTLGAIAPGLDAAWADPGDPAVLLHWPEAGITLTMSARAPTLHVVAASPPGRDAVAVEVQTNAPQGLRRLQRGEPGGLALLTPGSALELTVELEIARAPH